MLPGSRAAIQDKYIIQQELPSGLLGPTMLVVSKETGTLLVCKVCHKSFIPKLQSFRERLSLLNALKLPVIVPYIDVIETDDDFFLFREVIQTGSLADFIQATDRIHDRTIMTIWHMLVDTFQRLHAHGLFPSSVRPNNIFIESDTSLRITDLYELRSDVSWALHTPDPSHLAFLAPEFFDGSAPSSHYSDVWSLGVILVYLRRRTLPWSTKNIFLMVKSMQDGGARGAAGDEIEAMARAILVQDVTKRPPIGVCGDPARLRAMAGSQKPSTFRQSGQTLITATKLNSSRSVPGCSRAITSRDRTYTVRSRLVQGACSPRLCPFATPIVV